MGRRLVACTENVIGLLDTTGQRGKPAAFSSAAAHRTPELRRARADECVNIVPVSCTPSLDLGLYMHHPREDTEVNNGRIRAMQCGIDSKCVARQPQP
eukprot:1434384-Prymnesium_polylepis.1